MLTTMVHFTVIFSIMMEGMNMQERTMAVYKTEFEAVPKPSSSLMDDWSLFVCCLKSCEEKEEWKWDEDEIQVDSSLFSLHLLHR